MADPIKAAARRLCDELEGCFAKTRGDGAISPEDFPGSAGVILALIRAEADRLEKGSAGG